jgi:hypothetical protein
VSFQDFRHPELPTYGLELPSQAAAQVYTETAIGFPLLAEDDRLPDRSTGGIPTGCNFDATAPGAGGKRHAYEQADARSSLLAKELLCTHFLGGAGRHALES